MNYPLDILEKLNLITSDPIAEVIKEFCSLGILHVDYSRVCAPFASEPDIILELDTFTRRLIETEELLLSRIINYSSDCQYLYLSDIIGFSIKLDDESPREHPVLAFWSLVVLCSEGEEEYNEAKNFWLSACVRVMRTTLAGSDGFKQATAQCLLQYEAGQDQRRTGIAKAVAYEILLRSSLAERYRVHQERRVFASAINRLIRESLPCALEDNAQNLAEEAFAECLSMA